jgi:hypothetical protein
MDKLLVEMKRFTAPMPMMRAPTASCKANCAVCHADVPFQIGRLACGGANPLFCFLLLYNDGAISTVTERPLPVSTLYLEMEPYGKLSPSQSQEWRRTSSQAEGFAL